MRFLISCVSLLWVLSGLFAYAGEQKRASLKDQERSVVLEHTRSKREMMERVELARKEGDLGKVSELIAGVHAANKVFVERVRSLRQQRLELQKPENGGNLESKFVEVPLLPTRLEKVEKGLEAIDRSAPWIVRPGVNGGEFIREWFRWKQESKSHWEGIRKARKQLAGNKSPEARFRDMIESSRPGLGKDFLIAAKALEQSSGPEVLVRAMADPASGISRLRKKHLEAVTRKK